MRLLSLVFCFLFVSVVTAQLKIVKKTNGVSIATDKIPRVRVGNPVTWTYEVTNTGKTILSGVRVTDSRLAASAIRCPTTPAFMNAGASMTCTATGTAQKCGYTNQGCVSATGIAPVCAGSAYNGVVPSISITKYTNFFTHSQLRNASTAVCIKRCDAVTWTYVVSNTGDELLTNVRIVDNQFPHNPPTCPITKLAPWWSITCHAFGQAQSGPYTNFATAYGSPTVGGADVSAWDKNSFLGSDPRIRLTVTVNGVIATNVAQVLSNPVKSTCDPPHYRDGEGEGEGDAKTKSIDSNTPLESRHVGALSTPAQESTGELPTSIDVLSVADQPASDSLRVFEPLGEGEGEGKNKKGNSGQKDGAQKGAPTPSYKDGAYVALGAPVTIVIKIENVGTEAFHDVYVRFPDADTTTGAVNFVPFTAADVMCNNNNLTIGGTITCTTPTFSNFNSGVQLLNVAVSAIASCSNAPEPVVAQGKWYTPVTVPVTPGGSGDSSSSSSDGGEGGDNKATGCDATWWAMAAATNYPSYWTPNTAFYKAAGLSKDPLSGQSLTAVLQASGDGLNAFYRAAATALLNAATVHNFGLSKWEVQSRIESALSRYFRSGSSDTTSIDLWRKQFDAWARPC